MEFEERKVLIIVRSRPFGTIINFEGWRAAVSMIGMDHEPTMLFMGDGVYCLLKTMDQTPIRMFKSTYEGFDGKICASGKSLENRGISDSEIFEGVEILDENGIGQAMTENEVVLTF
ncbi:MAG: DsrE family protein [Candidatus Thorarchaeota archaeon]|jgi:sulfur relay (sulfurtransferase) DsrF/TusC family protein